MRIFDFMGHYISEVLQDPTVINKISDTKAAGEVKALESFYAMLQTEPSKAFYGLKHIEKANEAQAIETLLISDKLFRLFLCFLGLWPLLDRNPFLY